MFGPWQETHFGINTAFETAEKVVDTPGAGVGSGNGDGGGVGAGIGVGAGAGVGFAGATGLTLRAAAQAVTLFSI